LLVGGDDFYFLLSLVNFHKTFLSPDWTYSHCPGPTLIKNPTIMTSTGQKISQLHTTAPTAKKKAGQPALAKAMCQVQKA